MGFVCTYYNINVTIPRANNFAKLKNKRERETFAAGYCLFLIPKSKICRSST